MNRLKTCFFFSFLFAANFLYAQQYYSLTGMVFDTNKNPIPYATICVNTDNDSSLLLGAITDMAGRFTVDSIPFRNCVVRVSYVGFMPFSKSVDLSNDAEFGNVTLAVDTLQLEAVAIVRNGVGLHTLVDRTLFVPDARVVKSASTSFDLLSKIPGISVRGKDMQIKVAGSTNVLVLVNGASSGRNINAINPKDIERIELINNPSAEFGSETTSVINIVLKGQPTYGLSLSANAEYSCFNPVNNSGFQIGYVFKNVKLFAGYQLGFIEENDIQVSSSRLDLDEGGDISLKSISNDGRFTSEKHQLQCGADILLGQKALISVTANYKPISFHESASDNNTLSGKGKSINYQTKSEVQYDAVQQNYNLFLKKEFIKPSHELELNSDFMWFSRDRNNLYSNSQLENVYGSFTQPRKENTKTDFYTLTSKLVYSQPITIKWQLRGGVQYSRRQIDNTFTSMDDRSWVDYAEAKSTLFANANYQGNYFLLKLGMGAEHQKIDISDGSIVKQKWFYLPSVSLGYKFSKEQVVTLSYNQWLTYPHYLMLIPFTYHSDDSLSATAGNPNLKPVKNGVVKLSHSADWNDSDLSITCSAFYTHSDDKHELVYALNDGELIRKWQNLTWSKSVGGSVESSLYLLDALDISIDGSAYYVMYPNSKYNGWVGEMYLGLEVELPYDLLAGIETTLTTREYEASGYYKENPYIDRIYLRKSLFGGNGHITIMAIEPFFRLKETEKYWDNSFTEYTTTKHQSFALALRFSYFFNRGKKVKRTVKESLIDDQNVK